MIITLEIPKEIETRIVDGYVNWHGHDGTTNKVAFMTAKIYEHIMEMVGITKPKLLLEQ